MAFFRTFPNTRPTAPDLATLQATLRTALSDPTVIIYAAIGNGFLAAKDGADWSAADITGCQSAIDACVAETPQSDVKAYLDTMPLTEKAIYLTILDRLNLIGSKLPTPLIAITPAQWIAAVKQKVDSI